MRMNNLLMALVIIILVLVVCVYSSVSNGECIVANKKGRRVTWKDPIVTQKIIPNRHGVI